LFLGKNQKAADLGKLSLRYPAFSGAVAVGIQDSGFEIQDREACSLGKAKSRRLKKTSLRYPAFSRIRRPSLLGASSPKIIVGEMRSAAQPIHPLRDNKDPKKVRRES
jgi:hypothetical protein